MDIFFQKSKLNILIPFVIIALGSLWYSAGLDFSRSGASFEQKLKCETLGLKMLELRKDEYISVRDYKFVYSEKLDTCLYIADEIVYKDEKGYTDKLIIIDILTNQIIFVKIAFAGDESSVYSAKFDAFENLKKLYLPEITPDVLGLPPLPKLPLK